MKRTFSLVLIAAFFAPQPAAACTIPVFRYALEKWDLTPYDVMVFHRGELSPDLEKELKKWEGLQKSANIEVTRYDLDDQTTKLPKIWQKEGDTKQLPYMIVRYRAADPEEPSAWRGACSVSHLDLVLDSPLRRATLAHLTRGATTVFILLTSDDNKQDRATYDMLAKELPALEGKIKLPVQSDTGPQIKLPIPLKVSFPILVLDRKNPEEAGFVRLLLGTEERLADMKGPIVFPIFGRGRVLGGLVGEKELNPESIMEVAKFLCRECSCQVKELNPGIDMVMTLNWEDAFNALYDKKEAIAMPKLPTPELLREAPKVEEKKRVEAKQWERSVVDGPVIAAVERVSPSVQAPPQSSGRTPFDLRFGLWLGAGVASGLVLLSGGWLVYQTRK